MKKKFFKAVATVTLFSVCEKFLGFTYRIFLSRTIGAEGMGVYQVALSVFALILTACCSGIPVTVSRLMTKYKAAGDKKREQRVITAGILLALAFSIPVTVLFYFLSDGMGFIFADFRSLKVFKIILPGIVFTSVYSVLRGVFWGNKDFLPYSVIELLEEVVMIIAGVILITAAATVTDGAVAAGIAVLLSFTASFTLATLVFFARKNRLRSPKKELGTLFLSSAPITAMRTANSLASSLVSVILPLRLINAAGMKSAEAMSAFGAACGQAIPLLSVPTTLIGSFILVLIPEISENYYRKNYAALKRNVEKSVKFSLLIACVFTPVFAVCGKEIGVMIFSCEESGRYLAVAAFLMPFMSVSNITTSILNSIGKETKTLLYFIAGTVLMLAAVWFLPAFCGIYSLFIGFAFVFGTTAVLNLKLIGKELPEKPACYKFAVLSFALIVPAYFFGLLARKILLPIIGGTISALTVSTLTAAFCVILYIGCGVINASGFIKILRRKNRRSNARLKTAP